MPRAESSKTKGTCPKCLAPFQYRNGTWVCIAATNEQGQSRLGVPAGQNDEPDFNSTSKQNVVYSRTPPPPKPDASFNEYDDGIPGQQLVKETILRSGFVPAGVQARSTEKLEGTSPSGLATENSSLIEAKAKQDNGQNEHPHDKVRKAIATVIDSGGRFDPLVLHALTLALHPWPDNAAISPAVTSAIAAELLPSFNINHPDILEVAIDRLLRLAEAVSFEMVNDLCDKYKSASDILQNARFDPGWHAKLVEGLPLLSPLGIGVPRADEDGNLERNQESETTSVESSDDTWLPLITELLNASIVQRSADIGELCGGESADTTVEQLAIHFGIELPSSIFDEYMRELDTRSRDVLVSRTFNLHAPETLVDVATRWGVTRERVRQIEKRAKESLVAKFEKAFLKFGYRTILPMTKRLVWAEELFEAAQAVTLNSDFSECLAGLILDLFGPWNSIGNWKYHASLSETVDGLKQQLLDFSDQYGFLEPEQISTVCAPIFKDESHRDAFLKSELGFGCFFNRWMTKNTIRCQVLAALKSIGRPATKQEVGDLLDHPRNRVGSIFGNIPEVVRADRFRWGFKEWIDDEYDGIVGEIEQRIEEYNGSVPLRHLLQEIPALFNVAESSVKAYVFSDAFVVENGMVRFASADDFKPHSPERLSDAVQINGRWGHKVRIFDRHLKGYSLGVHFDIAFANGLRPGDDLVVPIENHEEEVSLIWRPQSINRLVDVGRVGNFLTEQNYEDGDDVIIIPSGESVKIVPVDTLTGQAANQLELMLDSPEDQEFNSHDPLLDLLGD